ncbi:hypothetical protein MCOR25_001917 [Pyricularia grisea]|uniref:NADH-ubiquinone oxidoreductase-like protein n=1 Tax=Pyricularia grisea TaxID=148305 RepID=A0A6P8BL87_PYRGI|nr:uncharacterized protein PgNI_01941 [Pyricularia grisea]KAI6379786.1 hypothetical protein MCOR25_001917 [Pyricularia grisea]TLD17430.1 hypothetical protein PgNI_01941 [Pyricularia grisea]
MASQAAAKAAGGVMNIATKQTLQSAGIWEKIRKSLSIDPNRSNGVPLNPHFRYPAPGSNDPMAYDDPVTLPAGDIADNPYWKRDHRRNYPALSVIKQADAVALLTVGNAAAPKAELIGEAGEKALVQAKEAGNSGLAAFFEKNGKSAALDVFVGGLPPTPAGESLISGKWDVHKYEVSEQSYSEEYPARSFK